MGLRRAVAALTLLLAARAAGAGAGAGCAAPPPCSCADSVLHRDIICDLGGGAGGAVRVSAVGGVALQVECERGAAPHALPALGGALPALAGAAHVALRRCGPPAAWLRALGAAAATSLELREAAALGELRRERLAGLHALARLALVDAGVTRVSADAFADAPSLAWLDLRSNRLRLEPDSFRSCPGLLALDLDDNDLRSLPPGTFAPLGRLARLRLRGNNLVDLSPDSFLGLASLKDLDLSSNGLKDVPVAVFVPLKSLIAINLISNDLTSLPDILFKSNRGLNVVRLSQNPNLDTLPSNLFGALPDLKEVYVDDCNLRTLPDDLFEGSAHVQNASFARNNIENIPESIFSEQENLITLNLGTNKIKHLHENIFAKTEKLEYFNVDDNELEVLSSSVFAALINLRTLSVENNKLREIAPDCFTMSENLVELNLARNRLGGAGVDPDSCPAFSGATGLRLLNVSHNEFRSVCAQWRNLTELKFLDLGHNLLGNLSASDVEFVSENSTVDVRHNEVESGSWADAPGRPPRLLLAHNPLRCDCRLAALAALPAAEGGRCAAPPALAGRALRSLRREELVCEVAAECPRACRCLARPHDAVLLLRCPAAAAAAALRAPPDLRRLGLRSLELRLDAPAPPDLLLPPLPAELTALRLAGLNITSLRFMNLPERLEEVDLSSNAISRMEESTARLLLEGGRRLRLAGNPLDCECDNLPLLETLLRHRERVPDLDDVLCATGARRVTARAACARAGAAGGARWAAGAAAGAAAAALAAAAGAALALHRRRGRAAVGAPAAVAVVCAREDRDFAASELAPELEREGWRVTLAEEADAEEARAADALLLVVSAAAVRRAWAEEARRAAPARRAAVVARGPAAAAGGALLAGAGVAVAEWGEPWFWERLRAALRRPARRPCPVGGGRRARARDDEAGLIRAPSDAIRGDGYCDGLKINPASKHSEV